MNLIVIFLFMKDLDIYELRVHFFERFFLFEEGLDFLKRELADMNSFRGNSIFDVHLIFLARLNPKLLPFFRFFQFFDSPDDLCYAFFKLFLNF